MNKRPHAQHSGNNSNGGNRFNNNGASNNDNKDKETSWGGVAGWYDELLERNEGTYQKEVVLPNLLRILDIAARPRMKILDLACGQGYFTREFDKAGAKVVASDIAKELIGLARLHSSKSIEYIVSPADDISFLKPESVDAVTIVLAIQNIENLHGVIQECSRVLKKGGSLIMVMNHPAFRIPKRTSWQWDDAASQQYRRIDAYMSESRERIDMNPGAKTQPRAGERNHTVSFHRPLQLYVKSLAKAGLLVSRLEEWVSHKESKPGARGAEENRIRKEIPMFMAIEARKI